MKHTTFSAVACALLANIGGTIACGPKPAPLKREVIPLDKRAGRCGAGVGRCPTGECCSEAGYCGTTSAYCAGSQCQLDYSDACDTFFGPLGSCTDSVPRPKIGSVPYGTPIRQCVSPGMIALTFDDGPYFYTTDILNRLDDLGVKATFFIAGNNRGKGHIDDPATGWAPIVQRAHAAGHHLASHTWTHRDLNQVNASVRRTEMIYNEMAFRNIFGFFPTYMRAPYLECSAGTGCQGLMNDLGYHIADINVDTKDFEYNSPDLIQNAKNRFSNAVSTNAAANSYIVLAHDVQEQTVTNLTAYMVEQSRARGYRLVTLGECLGDPKENWYRSAPMDTSGTCGPSPSFSTTSRASATSSSTTRSSSLSTSSAVSTTTTSTPPTTLRTTSTASSTLSATPSATPSGGLKVSRDQKCGGSSGQTCNGSSFGNCCSYYGFW